MARLWVDVDIEDALEIIPDDVILKTAREIKGGNGDDYKDSAITAINQIRAGKADEAIITLERAFLPAWEDTAACEARYREVMGMA